MMQKDTYLFQYGDFTLSSGQLSNLKIECDVLQDGEWLTLAMIVVEKLGSNFVVEGVPTGGDRFAATLSALMDRDTNPSLLIVDDVLTTGASMERQRAGRRATGVVAFARNDPPTWVQPIFRMWT